MMHDEVVSRLRHVLTEGEIPPGARIPERELCASFAISRTPLREALKVLAAEGLVVLLPNRGSRAAKLTQKDVKELFEVCEALEAAAGELACPRISDAQLREIADMQANMVEHYRAQDLISYYRCNRLIHEAIVRAADNAVLAGFYESVAARIRRARFITPMTPEHWALAIQEHEGRGGGRGDSRVQVDADAGDDQGEHNGSGVDDFFHGRWGSRRILVPFA